MVSSVFKIHVFLCKVTPLIFEVLTVHRENLGEYACIDLFFKFISWIDIDEHSSAWSMGMQIKKTPISFLLMEMHNDFLYCIDRAMVLRTWINITSIQINPIGIYSVVTPCYSIRVKNWKNIENHLISQYFPHLRFWSQLINNASHDMWTWNFSWVNSSSDYDTFFITIKGFRLRLVYKEIFILNGFFFVWNSLCWTYCEEFDWSAFESFDDRGSVKIYIWEVLTSIFTMFEEFIIIQIRPWIEKGKKHFLIRWKSMLKGPFDPSLTEFLEISWKLTIPAILTLSLILSQQQLSLSLNTGTNPSFNNLDYLWYKRYLILHIFYFKGYLSSLWESLDGKVKPGSVIILRMVSSNPYVILE